MCVIKDIIKVNYTVFIVGGFLLFGDRFPRLTKKNVTFLNVREHKNSTPVQIYGGNNFSSRSRFSGALRSKYFLDRCAWSKSMFRLSTWRMSGRKKCHSRRKEGLAWHFHVKKNVNNKLFRMFVICTFLFVNVFYYLFRDYERTEWRTYVSGNFYFSTFIIIIMSQFVLVYAHLKCVGLTRDKKAFCRTRWNLG